MVLRKDYEAHLKWKVCFDQAATTQNISTIKQLNQKEDANKNSNKNLT